jgi:hypothetical protein
MASQGFSADLASGPGLIPDGQGVLSTNNDGTSAVLPSSAGLSYGPDTIVITNNVGVTSPFYFGLPVYGTPPAGAAVTIKQYIMAVYNTVTNTTEFWLATGTPNSNNPSGQATLANSLRIHSKFNA